MRCDTSRSWVRAGARTRGYTREGAPARPGHPSRIALVGLALIAFGAACASREGPTALIYREHPVLIGPTLYLASADSARSTSAVDAARPHARFEGFAEFVVAAASSTTTDRVNSTTIERTTTTTTLRMVRDDINKNHYRATRGRNDVLSRINMIRPHCWGTFPVVFAWAECQVTVEGQIYRLEDIEPLAPGGAQ